MNFPFPVKIIKGNSFIRLDGMDIKVHSTFLFFQITATEFLMWCGNSGVGGVVGMW